MITWALGATAALLSLQTPRRPFGKQGSVCYITWLCHKPSAWVLGPVCVHRLCPLVRRWPRTSLHCAHSSLSVSALVMGTWQLVGFLFLFLKRGNVITALKIDIHMSLFQRSLNTCKGEVAPPILLITVINDKWGICVPAFLFPSCTVFLSPPLLTRMHTTYKNYPPGSPGKVYTPSWRNSPCTGGRSSC